MLPQHPSPRGQKTPTDQLLASKRRGFGLQVGKMVLGSKQTANQCQRIPVTGTSAALGPPMGCHQQMTATSSCCRSWGTSVLLVAIPGELPHPYSHPSPQQVTWEGPWGRFPHCSSPAQRR